MRLTSKNIAVGPHILFDENTAVLLRLTLNYIWIHITVVFGV